ncbi:MAG: hypothetical protein LBN21_12960 [Treponema sp.]|jgi:hypothetical protein|nr:hypothetical protein [Treponema sp.]
MNSDEYFNLQEKSSDAYQKGNYDEVKKICFDILENIPSITASLKGRLIEFKEINKPFIDDALNIVNQIGIDEPEKEILKIFFSERLVTKGQILEYFDISYNTFKKDEYAEQLYNFLGEIDVLSDKEVNEYLDGKSPVAEKWEGEQNSIEKEIIMYLSNNPGFLQKDIQKLFAAMPQYESWNVETVLSELIESGKIEKQKSGRSFVFSVKNQ